MPSFTIPRSARQLELNRHRPSRDLLVVTARGDVDAAGVADLITAVQNAIDSCYALVLDFTAVDFFGIEGLRALDILAVGQRRSPQVVLVPSAAVSRLLQLCPTAPPIPLARDVTAALAMVNDRPAELRTAV